MQTVMLSPLFPPDTSPSAIYAKQLASKLASPNFTVLAYGILPESVQGVTVKGIDKSGFKVSTVVRCLRALFAANPTTLLVHNGPSTDVPALLYKLVRPSLQMVYIESDVRAANQKKNAINHFIHTQLKKRSATTISLPVDTNIYLPTEILPFEKTDPETEATKKSWWEEHHKLISSYVRT